MDFFADEVPPSIAGYASEEDVLQEELIEDEIARRMAGLSNTPEMSAPFNLNEPQVVCQITMMVTNAACLMEKMAKNLKHFTRW